MLPKGALGFRPWSFAPCGGKLPFGGSSITVAASLPLVRLVLATVSGLKGNGAKHVRLGLPEETCPVFVLSHWWTSVYLELGVLWLVNICVNVCTFFAAETHGVR